MHHRPKCKIQNFKTLEDNIGENLGYISYIVMTFSDTNQRHYP